VRTFLNVRNVRAFSVNFKRLRRLKLKLRVV
jgi:hypothetical protein